MARDREQGFAELCDEAADWVVELHTSENLAPLFPPFREWLDASPANHREYLRQEEIWRALGEPRKGSSPD